MSFREEIQTLLWFGKIELMKEIKIEVENGKLADMEVDQPIEYSKFRFNESAFIGYWVATEMGTNREYIIFYIGERTFCCKNTPYNTGIFESILNPPQK